MVERRPVLTGIPFGKYQLVKRLARGGMAEVFLARQSGPEGFQRTVAVKRILPHLVDSQDFVRMFLDEARLAAQLSHANIVHIYDFGKVDEHYFIAMEYVDGIHSGVLINQAESERMPDVLAARIGADACAGLHYAHELHDPEGRALHLVHRDVSPPNLLVSYDGAVKLVDFGIAKAVSSIEQTRPGVVKGKFAYMSPEQTIGQKLDRRSDVFSLAVLLWEVLAGRVLVPRNDPIEGMRMIRDGRVPPIERERPDIAPGLASALERALKTRREDRCTALELGRALEEFIKSSRDSLGSGQELAEWVRERFPRDSMSGNYQQLQDGPVGTRPATGATHTALPTPDAVGAEGSGRRAAVPPAAMAARSGSRPALVPRAGGEMTSAAMPALPMAVPLPAAGVDEPTGWSPPPARATRTGQTDVGRSGSVDETLNGSESSIIVAPEWLDEEGGQAFDTVADARDGDTVEGDASETAETNDFSLQRYEQEPRMRRILAPEVLTGDEPERRQARSASHVGGKSGRIALIIAAGAAIGVGSTVVLSQFGRGEEPEPAGTPVATQGASPAPTVTPMPSGESTPGPAASGAPEAGPTVTVPRAVIEVVTAPRGARVRLGDLPPSESPTRFQDVPPGQYRLRVSLHGYQSVERDVVVGDGEHRTIELELLSEKDRGGRKRARAPQPPASGVLKVKTRPYSDVYLDGRRLGQTPLVTELKPGRYTLQFVHPGKPTQRRVIDVREGDETRLDFALQ